MDRHIWTGSFRTVLVERKTHLLDTCYEMLLGQKHCLALLGVGKGQACGQVILRWNLLTNLNSTKISYCLENLETILKHQMYYGDSGLRRVHWNHVTSNSSATWCRAPGRPILKWWIHLEMYTEVYLITSPNLCFSFNNHVFVSMAVAKVLFQCNCYVDVTCDDPFLRVCTSMAPFLVLRKRSGLSAAIFGPCRVYINDEFNLLPLLSVHDILEMLDLD